MGSFLGHTVPSIAFCIYGLWWIICMFDRFYRSRHLSVQFRSSMWFGWNWCCCCGRGRSVAVESLFLLAATLFGIVGETVTGFEHGMFSHMGNAQHISMYALFGLHGFIQILVQIGSCPLPSSIEYFTGMLAFAVEGILFAWHLHGRTPMDVQVHTLLLYVIIACVGVVAVECVYRFSVMVSLARGYLTLLQGTWFMQIGFILYPPFAGMAKWDQHNHEQMMNVTTLFAWHCAVDFTLLIVIGQVIWLLRYRHLKSDNCNNSVALEKLLVHKTANGNAHPMTPYRDDSDSEI